MSWTSSITLWYVRPRNTQMIVKWTRAEIQEPEIRGFEVLNFKPFASELLQDQKDWGGSNSTSLIRPDTPPLWQVKLVCAYRHPPKGRTEPSVLSKVVLIHLLQRNYAIFSMLWRSVSSSTYVVLGWNNNNKRDREKLYIVVRNAGSVEHRAKP